MCGVALQVNKSTSQVDVQVLNLKLDELELASLRGDLQEAALHVNFDTHMGRGAVNVTGPRYSGLQVCCRHHALRGLDNTERFRVWAHDR